MSNTENKEEILETKKVVTITPEDCAAGFSFWEHFKVPYPPELKQSMDEFKKSPTVENQENIKYWLCKAITETKHEVFEDPMFQKIKEELDNKKYEMQFDRDLENELSKK